MQLRNAIARQSSAKILVCNNRSFRDPVLLSNFPDTPGKGDGLVTSIDRLAGPMAITQGNRPESFMR